MSWRGVVASQKRGGSPVVPFAEVEVLPCEQALAPRSWRAIKVISAAQVKRSCRVHAPSRLRSWFRWAPPRREDDDTAAARGGSGRASLLFRQA